MLLQVVLTELNLFTEKLPALRTDIFSYFQQWLPKAVSTNDA